VKEKRSKNKDGFRAWVADFDDWPKSWMGVKEDLDYGRKLLPWLSGFLQALYSEGLTRKTFAQYRDNLWLLGGTIIREVSLYGEYRYDPLEKLSESVANDGILPDHYDQMSESALRAFERTCRRFEKYLQETHLNTSE